MMDPIFSIAVFTIKGQRQLIKKEEPNCAYNSEGLESTMVGEGAGAGSYISS